MITRRELFGALAAPLVMHAKPANGGGFHTLENWDRCTGDVNGRRFLARLKSEPCYGGLDLAAVNDLTAFVLVWPVDEKVYVYPWFWLPSDNLAERAKRDGVPYVQWAEQGYLELTPGNVTDWRYVTARIKQLAEVFDVRQIGFDRYGARDTVSDLMDAGISVEDIGQGYVSMNAPSRRLHELVLAKRLVHTGHPILRWNVDCCAVSQDPAGNIKPVKPDRQRGSKRIDGVVAAIMAVDCAMRSSGDGYADLTCTVIG